MVATAEAAALDLIRRGRADPVWFIEEVIGSPLWSTQRDIARAVFRCPRVAVKACHSSGKTFLGAHIVLAFFYLYPGCKILTTAPTWMQVEKLLWGELAAAFAKLQARYPDMGGTLTKTQLAADKNWWALGLSTDEGVRFQGHHAPHILIVFDEAPGVGADIWEATEGNRAGGRVHQFVMGNPVVPSGPFYDVFTAQRAGWETYTIDAFDTPNLAGLTPDTLLALTPDELDDNPQPKLTTRRWVRERLEAWGEDSPAWQARVRGQFPTQSADSLIALSWLEAVDRKPAVDDDKDQDGIPKRNLAAGVDVAGPGEAETSLCLRCGPSVLLQRHWAKAEAVGDVIAALRPLRARLGVVNVDSAGSGYHFATQLRDALPGVAVRFVNVGEGVEPHEKERFVNLKAKLYWGLRERFRAGDVRGKLDRETVGQLAGIRYGTNARGQTFIEKKEDARRRGVDSPDRAEAVMLAFAAEGQPAPIRSWTTGSTGKAPGNFPRF